MAVPIAEKGQKTIYILPPQASFAIAQIRGSQAASGVQVVVPDGVATLHIRARSVKNEPVAGVGVVLRDAGKGTPGQRAGQSGSAAPLVPHDRCGWGVDAYGAPGGKVRDRLDGERTGGCAAGRVDGGRARGWRDVGYADV